MEFIIAFFTIAGGIGALYVIFFGQEPIFKLIRSWREQRAYVGGTYFDFLPQGTSNPSISLARASVGTYQAKRALYEIERAQSREKVQLVSQTDPFIGAEVLLLKGEALLYLSDPSAIPLFSEVIQLLEPFVPKNDTELRRKEHFLGRTFNDVGYFYTRTKNYSRAEREYKMQALPRLRTSTNRSAYAHSLKNLAYLYALQGKLVAAEILCQEALEIFQSLNDQEGAALSLNTLGLVHVEARQHQMGRLRCKRALDTFKTLRDPTSRARGTGLACIGIGYSLRRLSSRDVHTPEESESFLREGKEYLTQAERIFDREINEPFRRVEALAELGCTSRDWARVCRKRSQHSKQAEQLELQAIEYLLGGIGLANEKGFVIEQADTLEDLAQVYFQRGDVINTLQYIEVAEALVPKEYFLSSAGSPNITEPITPFWALLGKTALLRGHLDIQRALNREAYKWYELAGAYFDLYASTTTLTNHAARSTYTRLRNLKAVQLADWRKTANQTQQDYHLRETRLREILDDVMGVIETEPKEG